MMIEKIQAIIRDLGYPEAVVELSADLSHGDFASNVALQYAKDKGVSPRDLAAEIVEKVGDIDEIAKIEIAGPGFINFWLADEVLIDTISDSDFNLNFNRGKKIIIEHSSPNLFKPFHIGHVVNNVVGEALERLMVASGAEVVAISYPSDVSLGIGKAVWAMLNRGVDSFEKLPTLAERLNFLGECYVEGTKAYEEDEAVQKQIRDITTSLYEKEPGQYLEAYELGKKTTLDYFKDITQQLGSDFADLIFESEAAVIGDKIVRDHTPDVFTQSEGAIVYEGEQDGLHTRVFINSEGYPTYEAKDLGLMKLKADRYHPDQSIIVTDNEQKEYFKVMLAAAGKIDSKLATNTIHVSHGRMTFKGQKMSSRLGGIPTAEAILTTIKEEVTEKSTKDLSDYDVAAIAIAALKFSILKSSPGANINFDPETSLSFEGDSGPYLQYSVVRINSIKSKAANLNLDYKISHIKSEDRELVRLLSRYKIILRQSIVGLAPQLLLHYLLQVAQLFNSYYATNQVINENDLKTSEHRLTVIAKVEEVLEHGLETLGIFLPSQM